MKDTEYELLKYLENRQPKPGNRNKARAAADRITQHLKSKYSAEVYGVGSLYLKDRTFTEDSDIDLVVKGLPEGRFLSICIEIENLSEDYRVELIPWEDANEYLRKQAEEEGEVL